MKNKEKDSNRPRKTGPGSINTEGKPYGAPNILSHNDP